MESEEKMQYDEIDEALAPLNSFMDALANIGTEFTDVSSGVRMAVDNVKIEMPIELDIITDEEGNVTLGSSSSTQTVETSFMPVLHKLKILIEQDGKDEHK